MLDRYGACYRLLVNVHKNLSVKVMEFLKNECIVRLRGPISQYFIFRYENLTDIENLKSNQPSCHLYHGVNIV
jgi:hypothetical protein